MVAPRFVWSYRLSSSLSEVEAAQALTARLEYEVPPRQLVDEKHVENERRRRGGNLVAAFATRLRWYHADVERATDLANTGDISLAAQLWKGARTDGIVFGVLSTRTDGLVRLPKLFRGSEEYVNRLKLVETNDATPRSEFDEMHPPQELAALAADGIGLGVGVGEYLRVQGRVNPVFCRLPPEFLRFKPQENRWYYKTIAGEIPITPGDGRWILHCPGGRVAPWEHGVWAAVGGAWISKTHAKAYDDAWQSKLANPARVATTPEGSTEEWDQAWFEMVADWGVNSVFAAKPGYDIKLIESNGRGHDVFQKTIDRAEREITIAIAGQEVTTDGGAGFQNSDIHKSIRADLIQATADALAYTVNTQCLPLWTFLNFGPEAVEKSPTVSWSVTPAKDRNADAMVLQTAMTALRLATEALKPYGKELDVDHFASEAGLRIRDLPKSETPNVKLDLAPTDLAKVVRVNEARGSQGLPGIDDERGQLFIADLDKPPAEIITPGDAVAAESDEVPAEPAPEETPAVEVTP